MNLKTPLLALSVLALAGCNAASDSSTQTMKDTLSPGSLVYAYPADGQSEISPRADVILRFSHALTETSASLEQKISLKSDDHDVRFSVELIDGGKSVKLVPGSSLIPGAEYTLLFSDRLAAGGRTMATPNATGPEGIQFITRADVSGVQDLDVLSDSFSVERMIPAMGTAFQPMDFSTFRLQLSQPVHPDWKQKGGIIELLDGAGVSVPVSVLAKGRAITIDPCLANTVDRCGREEDLLTGGETYTIRLAGVPGLYGGALDFTAEFQPKNTSPNVMLYQRVVDSGLSSGGSEATAQKSVLNGQVVNGITLESVLQGDAGPSQQVADLFAQLAYAPEFEGEFGVPLRIARNSKLLSSSLDILIGNLVPARDEQTGAILKTGDIKVTLLSDATGYLLPNPYSKASSAPRHIRLWMDVSLNADEPMANAALSQDIMGLELVGIARVQDGLLTIDAIGMVEPNLLGLEKTEATIAFRIQADTNADVQLIALDNREDDNEGPKLVSWMPGPQDAPSGNRQIIQQPGDPVILNFDEPLDRATVVGSVTLIGAGTEYAGALGNLSVRTDGTAVFVSPEDGLRHGVDYTLQIASDLTDLAGNGAVAQQLSFRLPHKPESLTPKGTAPLVLGTYPGFPCATEFADPANGSHGFCIDRPSANALVSRPGAQSRDELPVTSLPEDRAISVGFSTDMNQASINERTFVVERVDAQSATTTQIGQGEVVPGRLEKGPRQVSFYPKAPWKPGDLYRYTLITHPAPDESQGEQPAQCAGEAPAFICAANGYPLNTDILVDASDLGGPDMTIYFKGEARVETVFNPLKTLPQRDVNANLVVDCFAQDGEKTPGDYGCDEPFPLQLDQADENGNFPPSANAAKLVIREGQLATSVFLNIDGYARVGCPPLDENGAPSQDNCSANKVIYQNMALNSEVIGPTTDPETGEPAVEVLLYPTMIVTTDLDVYLSPPLGKQPAGPQLLRMRYAKDDPACESECSRSQPIKGYIVQGEDGYPTFRTTTDLLLDAPNLQAMLGTSKIQEADSDHNLYSYPIVLELEGRVTFFDDGRMRIRQVNSNAQPIDVSVITSLSTEPSVLVNLPLEIPVGGVYLNFVSRSIK